MSVSSNMDIYDKSNSFPHTPSLSATKLPFCLYDLGTFYAGKNYFTEREGLDNYLLFYTFSGSARIQYRGREYGLGPYQAALIHCDEYQLYRTGPTGSWNFHWMHYNGLSASIYEELINEGAFLPVDIYDSAKFEAYFDELHLLILKKDLLIDFKVPSLITKIMTELVLNKLNPQKNSRFNQHKNLIENALDYIQQNYASKISIDLLADITHLSKYYFIRLFKKFIGVNPYEYLIAYRIGQSKVLLKDTSLTVSEISSSIGYNDANNFIRDFKKYVGTTPLKYRNYGMI